MRVSSRGVQVAGFDRIAFIAASAPEAEQAFEALTRRYGSHDPEEADVIVALGGDGLMLETMHEAHDNGRPIYGMNRGSVGFLMNDYSEESLPARLERAEVTVIHPLRMRVREVGGARHEAIAFNEVSLLRERHQAAKLRILVDGKLRLEELICDGLIVATPAGSTAYNLSAHGPILPINSKLLALTPISAFRPRRWRGAILPQEAHVRVEVLETAKRPVAAVADYDEIRDVAEVEVAVDETIGVKVMFDPGHSLAERVLAEQFRF